MICVLYVTYCHIARTCNCVCGWIDVWHRPWFPHHFFLGHWSIVDTKDWCAIWFTHASYNYCNSWPPWTRSLFDNPIYIPCIYIFSSDEHVSMTSCTHGFARHGVLSSGRVTRWIGRVAFSNVRQSRSFSYYESSDIYSCRGLVCVSIVSHENVVFVDKFFYAPLKFLAEFLPWLSRRFVLCCRGVSTLYSRVWCSLKAYFVLGIY